MAKQLGIADDLKAYLGGKKSAAPAITSPPRPENAAPAGESTGRFGSWIPSAFSSSAAQSSSSSLLPGIVESDSCLSRKQRLLGFGLCLSGGVICFGMASLYLPLLLLKGRKFALLFSLGSAFVLSSFSFLWGFRAHFRHLFDRDRWPFTSFYFLTLATTVYFALVVRSSLLTLFSSMAQILALLWYVISYLPGGQKGLSFVSRLFCRTASKTVTNTLNV